MDLARLPLRALESLTAKVLNALARVEPRAIEAVEAERRWLESVLDLMPIPLLLLEPATARVLFANRAADRLAGGQFPRLPDARYYCTDAEGRVIPDEELPHFRAACGEHLEGVELEWHTPTGVHSLVVDSAPLPASFGHAAACMIGFTDVTALKRAQAELEEAVRARDIFLSIASHELRTPLTSVRLHIETLLHAARRARPLLPARVVDKIAAARSQIDRLAMLVDNLLAVSRISSGRLALSVEPTDMAAIVREVVAQLSIDLERAGCTLELRAPDAVMGRWDRVRLSEIVLNLASNAIKFGRGKPIEIIVEGGDGVARLVVRDHGIGIATEDQQSIFQRFERAVSARHYGGIGMGLWIVRQIVEAHGGQIGLESNPGLGSAFTVELPRDHGAPALLH